MFPGGRVGGWVGGATVESPPVALPSSPRPPAAVPQVLKKE